MRAALRQALSPYGQWGNWNTPLPVGFKIATIGDSIMKLGNFADSGATILQNADSGEMAIARQINANFSHDIFTWVADARGGGRYFSGANYGIPSEQTAACKARLIANGELWPAKPDVVVIAIGTNDISNGTITAATITANLQAMAEACMGRHIRVIMATIAPRSTNNAVATTAGTHASNIPAADARWTIWAAVNTWIRAYADGVTRPVWLWDKSINVEDLAPASGQAGDVKDNLTKDGLHPSPEGAYWSGKELARVLATMSKAGTWFDTDPSVANYFLNPSMTGTGGTKDSNTTGTLPDNWRLSRNSPTTSLGITPACSIEADGSFNKSVIAFASTDSGSPNAQENWNFRPVTLNIASTGIAEGQYVQVGFKVEASSWAYWRQCQITSQLLDNVSTILFNSYGNTLGTLSQEKIWPEGGTFWIFSEPMRVTAATANLRGYLTISTNSAGASGTGTMKISRPLYRICPNPRQAFPSGFI